MAAVATAAPATPARGAGKTRSARTANIVLVLLAACFLLPLSWLLAASVNADATYELAVPTTLTLENFAAIMTAQQTFIPLLNSFILAVGSALVTVTAAVLAAYPLSRYQMRFKRPFMYTILFGTCLPITAIMVPVYSLFVQLNLLDSLAGTIFFMGATFLPIAIWMTKNFMDSVPVSLEEAAWIDGASSMKALFYVVLPLMRPGLAVVFIFVFLEAWGNFFVPFILLFSPDSQPAAVSIFRFFDEYGGVAYGELAAFSILYSLPVIVLYIVSRALGGSFALSGAMKG
ncbi:carbohydrate ABC transporter permease [Arthrobacter sp. zg-Y859]|uniref:Carbohydrate ABC transporter permease n=1 Tax=Arthrobacter jinronghuae TaxID=2964609 RepID=A0ABT1NTR3_9MICC|nr:carbohydrate ABC transporter permease [Arthrobacter jinronghuae]MCQ1949869.1 carbohydrate ABC transporter permease [Arthrobacter jinronghuae]UWX80018.1 carbohydrate ABC transporter permease [Arthrobacter jinronghuae]